MFRNTNNYRYKHIVYTFISAVEISYNIIINNNNYIIIAITIVLYNYCSTSKENFF